ncbi:thioredoxin-dependent thiol peroxidase [Porticoccaceae bacterium]|nr:thioredoxin-dependent thiol peroxidase [Porticoccaceae bacterium]MDA9014552.1 thioredoxin-dependent thiol peroxidase [Porticoccaceae bacterium]
MEFLKVGTVAPAFSLLDQRGSAVSLADYAGKKNVVVYFYPKAMTPGCTVQACGIRDTYSEFEALDTVVLAVSPDSVDRLVKFEDKQELNFKLLSDEDHAVTESFGAWGLKKFMGREYMGVLRSTFVIDKQSNVVMVMEKVKTKTHHEDLLDWIKNNLIS